MAISLINVAAQTASNSSPQTPALPAGTYEAGDLLLVLALQASANATTFNPSGFTSLKRNANATRVMAMEVFYKVADGGETSGPSTTCSAAAAGWCVQMAAYRGVDTSNIEDVASVNSDGAAAQTWTPTGLTTATANAMAISFVGSKDDNALALLAGSEQGFTSRMTGSGYDGTSGNGSDYSVGMAEKLIPAASTAVTCPTWNQTTNFNDAWVGITVALRAKLIYTASAAVTGGTVAGSATMTFRPKNTGTSAPTVGGADAAATATFTAAAGITGTASATTGQVAGAATVTFVEPTYAGSAAPTIGHTSAVISASFAPPVYTGQVSHVIGGATVQASAGFSPPVYTATASPTIAGVDAAASAAYSASVSIGSLAAAIPAATGAASATFVPANVGSAGVTTGGAEATATATFEQEFEETVAVAIGGAEAAAAAGFIPLKTGSAAVQVAGATAEATATSSAPTFTLSAAVVTGRVRGTAQTSPSTGGQALLFVGSAAAVTLELVRDDPQVAVAAGSASGILIDESAYGG